MLVKIMQRVYDGCILALLLHSNTYCTDSFALLLRSTSSSVKGLNSLFFRLLRLSRLVSSLRDSSPWAHAPEPLCSVSTTQLSSTRSHLPGPAENKRKLTPVKEIVARHQQDRQRDNRRRPPPRRALVPRLVRLGRLLWRRLLLCVDAYARCCCCRRCRR